jgi:hypothetical protein
MATDFAVFLRCFLTTHLAGLRGCSPNTVASYRDTFKLLIVFLRDDRPIPPERLTLDHIAAAAITGFLNWLETNRHNSTSTRNQRLAAISSFARWMQSQDPTQLAPLPGHPRHPRQETDPTSRQPPHHRADPLPAERLAGSYVRNSPKLTLIARKDLVGVLIELPHKITHDEVSASMRPAQVFANPTDEQYRDLITALHGPWRTATRAVMALLSADGMSATEIGALLHYDPHTVRRWIARHDAEGVTGLPDRPRTGRPRLGSPRLGEGIRTLLNTPKAWTTARIWRELGRPKMSLRDRFLP